MMLIMKLFLGLMLIGYVYCKNELHNKTQDLVDETRGHHKKELWAHIAYFIATKIFVLKIVYAIIFFIILHKASYIISWFFHYIKDVKKEKIHHHHEDYSHHDYGPPIEYGYPHRGPPQYYGPTKTVYGPPKEYYEQPDNGPYEKKYNPLIMGNGPYKRHAYDADGSYAVKTTTSTSVKYFK